MKRVMKSTIDVGDDNDGIYLTSGYEPRLRPSPVRTYFPEKFQVHFPDVPENFPDSFPA